MAQCGGAAGEGKGIGAALRPAVALLVIVAAWGAQRPVPRPRFDHPWRVVGPGGGGSMYIPSVSPHSDEDVLVRCDMTGAYLSRDTGDSWRMFNLRGTVQFFAFDPRNRRTLYAGTQVLWRSTDLGATWKLVWPKPVTGVESRWDHAENVILTTGGASPSVSALAVDPGDSRTLYAAFSDDSGSGLYQSKDWGASWTKISALNGAARSIWVDSASTLYVMGGNFVTVRRGGKWQSGPAAASGDFVDSSAGFGKNAQLTVYGVTGSAIYVSMDGGASWGRTGLAGGASYQAIATSQQHPETAYVSYATAQDFGVAKTTNSGASWEIVWRDSDSSPAANVKGAWLEERFGPSWGGNPVNLGVSPQNPDLCFGSDWGRTMRTRDGGKTWEAVYSRPAEGGNWSSTGLDVTTVHGVHFDPFDSRRIFLAQTDTGPLRSEDGGQSWVPTSQGIPQAWVNTTYWMVFDPEVPGRVWAVASGTHDLPRPKMWRKTAVASYQGGVIQSSDGGRTWARSNNGMPQTAATHILLDPASPKEKRTLYVTGFGKGVYKSTDGGVNWTLKNNGISGTEPFAWRLARDSGGTLYLLVARRSEDGSIGNDKDGAWYRSSDGAEHWLELALPAGVNGPNGLAIDPRDPQRLYLAAWRRASTGADGGGGIYLSTDRGQNWQHVLARDQHVFDVTVETRNPDVLYATGFESSVWRSEDRGLNWTRVRGYNFKWGQRVFPDPRDAGFLFVATFGGSVWYGPAGGDPSAWEDIVGELAYSE